MYGWNTELLTDSACGLRVVLAHIQTECGRMTDGLILGQKMVY